MTWFGSGGLATLMAGLLVLLLVGSACSSDDSLSASGEPVPAAIAVGDRFLQVELETAECMIERGFQYVQRAPGSAEETSLSVVDSFLASRSPSAQRIEEAPTFETEGEYAAYFEALDGSLSSTGCRSQAESTVNAALFDPADLEESLNRAASSSEWVDAQNSWVGCAAEAGYEFLNPSEVGTSISAQLNDIVGQNQTPELTAEQELAVQELGALEESTRADLAACDATLQESMRAISAESFVDE